MAEDEELVDDIEENEEKTIHKKKTTEPGVIYLSTIPPTMNVKTIRQFFTKFGEVDRIFLQPDPKASKKSMNYFTEGWIEFKKKKIAKRVAENLNNAQVGGKRRTKYYDTLWNIKYLHRFRWTHLNERLSYENAVRQQRMRTEIAQVKRETNHYVQSVETSKRLKRRETKMKKEGKEWKEAKPIEIRQMKTQKEIQNDECAPDRTFLANIFSAK